MSQLRKRVGARIRSIRLARLLTQEARGERAGVGYKFLGEVERGDGNPTLDWLEAIAKAMDVTTRDLLADEPERPPAYRPLRAPDYSVVREARDSLAALLERFEVAKERASPTAQPRHRRTSRHRRRSAGT